MNKIFLRQCTVLHIKDFLMYQVFISVYKGAQGTTKDQLGRYCKVQKGVDDFALFFEFYAKACCLQLP